MTVTPGDGGLVGAAAVVDFDGGAAMFRDVVLPVDSDELLQAEAKSPVASANAHNAAMRDLDRAANAVIVPATRHSQLFAR